MKHLAWEKRAAAGLTHKAFRNIPSCWKLSSQKTDSFRGADRGNDQARDARDEKPIVVYSRKVLMDCCSIVRAKRDATCGNRMSFRRDARGEAHGIARR